MNAYSYYKRRFPFSRPARSDLSTTAAIRCHVVSAWEGLIDWRDAFRLVRVDVGSAIVTAPARLRAARRARIVRRAWARAFLASLAVESEAA